MSEGSEFPKDTASRDPELPGDSRTTVDPALAHGPQTGGAPLEGPLQPTDLLSSAERKELIGSMTPEDAQRIPELHEVDVPDDLRDEIEAAMGRYPQLRSASIPALWAVQRLYGWCTPEGIRQAAAVLKANAERARPHLGGRGGRRLRGSGYCDERRQSTGSDAVVRRSLQRWVSPRGGVRQFVIQIISNVDE